jgi:hypothetical protein
VPWGTLKVTRDHVAPPSVVPSSINEPPSLALPTSSATASDPEAQHISAVGQASPPISGSGTSPGRGSGDQVSPPSDVEAMSLTSPGRPGA